MVAYSVFESKNFLKQFDKLGSPQDLSTVLKRLRDKVYPQLKVEPHFGSNIKKLKGYSPESYRYRVGEFRFFCSIDEEKNFVVMTAVRTRAAGITCK